MRKQISIVALAFAAAAGLTESIHAQSGATPAPVSVYRSPEEVLQAPTNAALAYWRAWDTQPRELFEKVNDAYGASDDENWTPSEELTKYLDSIDGQVAKLIKCTRIEQCDWGIQYDEGFMAMLPHLGKIRSSTRLLATDARRLAVAGEFDAAADRIAAIYRMAGHLRSDRVLISPLVAIAVSTLASTQVEWLDRTGRLTPDGRGVILAAMEKLPAEDPFGMMIGLRGERDWAAYFIKRDFKGQDAGARLLKLVTNFNSEDDRGAAIAKMNGEQVSLEADRYILAMEEVVAAWTAPDGDTRLAAIEKSVEAGQHGPITQILMPSFGNCRNAENKARATLEQTTALLRKKE